jgi:hypothetical protein
LNAGRGKTLSWKNQQFTTTSLTLTPDISTSAASGLKSVAERQVAA